MANNTAAIRMRKADHEIRKLAVRLVVTEPGMRDCVLVNRANGRLITHITHDAAQKLQGFSYSWRVWLAVYMRNQLGEEFIQTALASPGAPCKQSELSAKVQAEHEKFIAAQYAEHVISVGWLAVPTGGHIDAPMLLDVPEVWLNLAKWECNN